MSVQTPPREPAAFSKTHHFPDCFDDSMRFLTPAMVPEVILHGRDYPEQGGPGKLRRKLEYDGVDAVLVMALDAPVLVTGWTEVREWATALASDRWAYDELVTMRAFMDREHKRSALVIGE